MYSGDKSNKCKQCDYASSQAGRTIENTFVNAQWRKVK